MSVKSILSGTGYNDKEFQSIVKTIIPPKNCFKTLSGEPAFSKYSIVVPGTENSIYEASLVGTAFDYLARAMVARELLDKKEKSTLGYIAVRNLEEIKSKVTHQEYRLLYNKTVTVLTDFIDFIYSNNTYCPDNLFTVCTEPEWDAWLKYMNKATSSTFSPIKNIMEIIDGAVYFAELEHIFRSGIMPEKGVSSLLQDKPVHIKNDLSELCKEFEKKFINQGLVNPNSVVVFNPNFGTASCICGGADADIYIDGTLYDFKTGKSTGYTWQEIAQLLTYFLLDIFANNNEAVDVPSDLAEFRINNIAFYRARFGQVEFCNIDNIVDEKFNDKFKLFFKHMLNRKTLF